MHTQARIKIFFILLMICFLSHTGVAQDTIIKMNSARINAKIIEINPKVVKYKKPSYPDGPVYIIDKRQIARIIYANGMVDTISLKPVKTSAELAKKDPRTADYGRNFFSLVVSDLFFGMVSVGYERILESGKWGIKIPVSLAFRAYGMEDSVSQYSYDNWDNSWNGSGYYYKYKIFSTGIDFYYYTGGQGTLKYFIGPSIEYGQFNYRLYVQSTVNQNEGYYKIDKGIYAAFLIKNGLLFQPVKNLNISFNLGAGFFGSETDYYDDYRPGPFEMLDEIIAFEIGLNVGYKF